MGKEQERELEREQELEREREREREQELEQELERERELEQEQELELERELELKSIFNFMKIKPLFFGSIDNGKIKLDNSEEFKNYCLNLNGEIQLLLEKRKKNRSLNQNSYYWGVVISLLSEYFGYESEEMHEALKYQFLRKGNVQLPTVRSTADMTTLEFEDYMARVRRWAAIEYSINIPEPNETNNYIIPE